MRFAEQIKSSLERNLAELGFKFEAIKLEHPAEETHGDYSTNIALVLHGQKTEHKSPRDLAQVIVEQLQKDHNLSDVVEKIEVAGPGFINFWLKKEALLQVLKSDLSVQGVALKGQKVMVEYTDQNPFKELHIGHLYSNAIGESISRLYEAEGANVKRAIYQGDIGLHVAKAVYGIQERFKKSAPAEAEKDSGFKNIDELEKASLKERIEFMGQSYAFGAEKYEKNKKAKEEIIKINKQIFDHDPEVWELYETGRRWSLEDFERIYKRLGTKFDFYYLESEVGDDGARLVQEYLKKGVFVEDEGAVIFPGEKYGLHNRVFINSLGLPTYEAKELGLAPKKYKDFQYDKSVIVTGNDIKEYFKVLLAALGQINPELADKTHHVPHGMVRLPEGKMSSRTGKVLTGELLIDEARKRLLKSYPEMEEETAEKVALGAIKYALLRSHIGSDIIFDFDTSLSFEGDSGPYIQYTHARIQSVLGKTTDYRLRTTAQGKAVDSSQSTVDLQPEEVAVLRHLYKFPEVLEDAAEQFAPNLVANFLFELAQKFNSFYAKHKILGEIGEVGDFRVKLAHSTGEVLKSGLDILGIAAPERM